MRNPRLLAGVLGLAVLGLVIFATAQHSSGGWPELHLHSGSVDGVPVIQAMPPDEAGLYRSMLWLIPAYLAAALLLIGTRAAHGLDRLTERHWAVVAGVAAVCAFAAAWMVGHVVLDQTPITDDEHAYLFHARVASSGRLAAEAPPAGTYFENIFIVLEEGRWYSQYPVGNSVLLAAGVLLGDPWLVPPLLAALSVLLMAATARRLFGPRAGAVTAVLAASSPFLMTISGTLLAHTACLACLALFLWAAVNGARPGASLGWVVVAAVAFGFAVYARPSSAMVAGLPLFGLLWVRSAACEDRWRRRLLFVGVGVVMVGGQLLLNRATTGHPLASGYVAYWVPRVGLRSPFGFGSFPWGVVHTPARALGNLLHNLVRLDAWLLGWPLSLAPPLIAAWRGRSLGVARWWLAGAGSVPFVVYFFYFWPGISDVGPVLYAETLVAWLPLAGGTAALAEARWRHGAYGLILAGLVLMPATFLRPQLAALSTIAESAGGPVAAAAELPTEERALVFCDRYLRPGKQGSWMAGRPNPWPDLRDRVLYVRSRGGASDEHYWQRYHADRRPYRLVYDRSSGFSLLALDD